MRALVVLLLAAVLGGCIGGGAAPACELDRTVATPMVDGLYAQTDPRQAWQTVVLSPADDATAATGLAWNASAGWSATAHVLSAPGERVFQAATVAPGTGKGNVTLSFESRARDGGCTDRGSLEWVLAQPKEGDAAMPGQGVHVMTAGFFENGTLFYTNIPEVDGDARWLRVPWYAWEGGAPLPVYVYDAARGEQPAHWSTPSSQIAPVTGQAPDTGTPADGLVDGAGPAADEQTGLGYFTTIPGFNEALQGLSTTTTRVVRLAPEQAYTRPGNEEHPLYGHAIVFYIKVLDVVDAPCPPSVMPEACRVDGPMSG